MMKNREEDNYNDIKEVTSSEYIEFVLDKGLSLYYSIDDDIWEIQFIDQEEGIETIEELTEDSLPLRIGDSYILEQDEFDTYKSIVESEDNEKGE